MTGVRCGGFPGRWLFDAVGVVAGPLDDPEVGPVAAQWVEGWRASDVSHDRGAEVLPLLRGERRLGRRHSGRCGQCG